MSQAQKTAAAIAGTIIAAALVLIVLRGGLIAWLGLVLGASVLAKVWLKPSAIDTGLSLGLAALLLAAWFGTVYHVRSTWESGEVVELALDTDQGAHTARLWVMDIDAHPVVYYDAEPHAARALLTGTPVTMTRNGVATTRIPEATEVDNLPEAEANAILEAMGSKYGARNDAATVYFVMLGRARDRVALIARLVEP